MPEELKLITVEEAADILHVRPCDIHALVRTRQLACVNVTPRRRLFLPEHLQQFIESRTREVPKKIVDKAKPSPVRSPKRTTSKTGGDATTTTEGTAKALREEMASWR